MHIQADDLSHPAVLALLQEHLDDMYATSPPESVHALDLQGLKSSDVSFYTAWQESCLLGCIAVKKHSNALYELKSMRTQSNARGKGVASALVQYVIDYVHVNGGHSLKLETGTQSYFDAARNLYRKFGFTDCMPFSDYTDDPNSHYMSLEL